jgi:hypothetical protein
MSEAKFTSLLWLIIPQVISIIMERTNISNLEAIGAFYNSELYSKLSEEGTKLWHLSALTLYDMYDEERTKHFIDYPEEL